MRILPGHVHQEDGPQIRAVDEVTTPTLVGICVGSALFLVTLAAVSCVCYRRKSAPAHKLRSAIKRKLAGTTGVSTALTAAEQKPLGLRKPVKSPSSGPAGPILKKSPSPTGQRSPPSQKSPSGDHLDKRSHTDNKQTKSVKCHFENEKESSCLKEDPSNEREKEVTEEKGKLGTLHFRLRYSSDKHALLVTIVKCSELPAKDANAGTSDPYVKLQLLPEKQHKVKTRVLRKTLSPVYDEDFTFYGLNPNQLQATTLHFVVLSFDRYSRDDVIGEVVCPLSSVDCEALDQSADLYKEIAPRNLKIRSQGRGELLVSLCYQPAANRLTVVVLKARNLPKMDITGLCGNDPDPYVKMYLLYNNQRIAKKKTHVKKRTVNPVFNESFVFEVPYNEGLANLSLEFLLLDWDRVTKNEVIGRLELGPKSGGAAQQHWLEVCSSPRRQIAEWHKLRD